MPNDNQMGLLGSELTPDEQKYLDTGGASGLPEPPAGETPPAPQPEPAPVPAGAPAPAAAAPEADDEEGDEPAAVDPKTGKQPPRRVPFRKFKALEDQLTTNNQELATYRSRVGELEQTIARADERMRIINEALAEPSPQQEDEEAQDPRPDPREDVFAYMEWQERQSGRLFNRLNEQLTGLSTRHEEFTNQTAQNTQLSAMENQFRADAQQFATREPKFAPAYVYLMNLRNRQYETLGIADQDQRNARILGEEREIISSAYNNRQNPAEMVYRLAIASGFDPNAAPANPGNGAAAPAAPQTPQAGAGAAPPQAPGAIGGAAPPSVAQVIEQVRSGQDAAQSLSAGGGTPAQALTLEQVANMSDEDFGRFMNCLTRNQQRAYLPGA